MWHWLHRSKSAVSAQFAADNKRLWRSQTPQQTTLHNLWQVPTALEYSCSGSCCCSHYCVRSGSNSFKIQRRSAKQETQINNAASPPIHTCQALFVSCEALQPGLVRSNSESITNVSRCDETFENFGRPTVRSTCDRSGELARAEPSNGVICGVTSGCIGTCSTQRSLQLCLDS